MAFRLVHVPLGANSASENRHPAAFQGEAEWCDTKDANR